MSDREFNRLTHELFAGCPVTLVLNRLMLALKWVVESGGPESEAALEAFCERVRLQDVEDNFPEGPV